jgi:hypothetical protein
MLDGPFLLGTSLKSPPKRDGSQRLPWVAFDTLGKIPNLWDADGEFHQSGNDRLENNRLIEDCPPFVRVNN